MSFKNFKNEYMLIHLLISLVNYEIESTPLTSMISTKIVCKSVIIYSEVGLDNSVN